MLGRSYDRADLSDEFETLLQWADQVKTAVRANADTPEDAAALRVGAGYRAVPNRAYVHGSGKTTPCTGNDSAREPRRTTKPLYTLGDPASGFLRYTQGYGSATGYHSPAGSALHEFLPAHDALLLKLPS